MQNKGGLHTGNSLPQSTLDPGKTISERMSDRISDPYEKIELDRIRTAYLRWRREVPPGRYARTNKAELYRLRELERALLAMLRAEGITSFSGKRVLDIGCGRGGTLRQLLDYEADPHRLVGVDLLFENLNESRRLEPRIATICCTASRLPFPDASVDVVIQFTLFTSILSSAMRQQIANEISRVLVPGGRLIWYDFAYNNPKNPNVRGIKRAEIAKLFPQFAISLRRITVAPPIARILALLGPTVYQLAASAKIFSTHDLCILRKDCEESVLR